MVGWCPEGKHTNRDDYLQIDMGAQGTVCAVATQGRRSSEWTTRYKLSVSGDGANWSFYKENNETKVKRN